MSDGPVRAVVDASVGAKLFIAEDLSDEAHDLFAHLAADPPGQLFVPDLFYIECANILWKQVRRLGYPAEKAKQDLEALGGLSLHSLATRDLMAEAFALAVEHAITAYDACYVALAERLGMPLVTADEKLARALADSDFDARWLGAFPIPPLPTE